MQTVKKATAYDGHRVKIKPAAIANGRRVITSLKLTVYQGSEVVASGKKVRLYPGKYKTVTSGTYRTYKIKMETRTKQVLHKAANAPATCIITSRDAVIDPIGGSPSYATHADCKSDYYPSQPKTSDQFPGFRNVGDTYPMYFDFNDETVTETYTVNKRVYSKKHHFTSGKRKLRVRDGGDR